MHPKPKPSAEATALRCLAEARLREQHLEAAPDRTEADTQHLLHELQVHQIELELQNEELRNARNSLETEMEKYSDLYDFAPVGYMTLDGAGTIHEVNLTCASLLETERSRLRSHRLGLYVAAADVPALNAFLRQVFEGEGKASCEVNLARQSKSPVLVRIDAAVAASGRECRAVVTDITERKQAEVDRLMLGKLEAAGIMAGGLAFDYSNLLATIFLNLELAQSLVPAGEEFLLRRLQTAEAAVLRGQEMTKHLVTLALDDAPIRKLTPLLAVIRTSVQLASNGSLAQPEFALAPDLWPAEVDVIQLGQALRNLAVNARESMPRGGVISVKAGNILLGTREKSTLPPGPYVRISIADKGAGIAKEALPRALDPYFSTKPRGNQEGMGLGLTICQAVAQKHGGLLAVESSPGLGTTFHLYLPAARIASAPPPEVRAQTPGADTHHLVAP